MYLFFYKFEIFKQCKNKPIMPFDQLPLNLIKEKLRKRKIGHRMGIYAFYTVGKCQNSITFKFIV